MNISLTTFASKRWRWPTLAVILGMIFLVRLGFWQLDRLEWRRGRNEETRAALNAAPVDLNQNGRALPLTTMRNQRATAQGGYDLDEQFIIRAQTFRGQQGVYLVTPLLLEDSDTAVLVNRGWLPVAEVENIKQFEVTEPVLVNGRIQLTETLSGGRETEISADNELFRIDVDAIAEELPYEILPVYLLEAPPETNTQLPYKLEADLALDEGNHLSYAIQWFSFAVLLGIIYIYYVYRSSQTDDSPTS